MKSNIEVNNNTDQQPVAKKIVQPANAYLLSMPHDILRQIGSLLPNYKSKAAYSHACERINYFFQPCLTKLKQVVLRELLQCIANGQQNEAEKIIASYPAFLLEELENNVVVEDYSGSKLHGTALQIAIQTGDVDMCEMMFPYFGKLENGINLALTQWNNQLASTKNDYSPFNFNTLIGVISQDTFTNNQPNAATDEVLQTFRDHFAIDDRFDMQNFIDALTAYNDNLHQLHNEKQQFLFCVQVLGYLQRLFPTCYAQAYCQGFFNVINNTLVRSLDLIDSSFFYPSRPTDLTGLGFTHFVYEPNIPVNHIDPEVFGSLGNMADDLKCYIERKETRFVGLHQALVNKQDLTNSPNMTL